MFVYRSVSQGPWAWFTSSLTLKGFFLLDKTRIFESNPTNVLVWGYILLLLYFGCMQWKVLQRIYRERKKNPIMDLIQAIRNAAEKERLCMSSSELFENNYFSVLYIDSFYIWRDRCYSAEMFFHWYGIPKETVLALMWFRDCVIHQHGFKEC